MDKRVVILMGAAAIVGALIGFALGTSVADEPVSLLTELESAAYHPGSEAWQEALLKTRAYLQER